MNRAGLKHQCMCGCIEAPAASFLLHYKLWDVIVLTVLLIDYWKFNAGRDCFEKIGLLDKKKRETGIFVHHQTTYVKRKNYDN